MIALNATTGQEILTLKGHPNGRITSVCFSPVGKRVASSGQDKTVRVWDAATGQELLTLRHIDDVYSVAFSPDGRRLASGSGDKTVKVWDAATGQLLVSLSGHASSVKTVCFSPDGKRLASSSHDKTVKLWDIATGHDEKSSDLVFLARLNDVPARRRWHRSEAAENEAKQQWFAATFHLRQLIAAKDADADQLKIRLNHCEESLRKP